jgi:hypothetical protein
LNPWRLHVVRHPDLSAHAERFDALIAATPDGGAVEYRDDAPKWWFLHHLLRRGFVLHGSNAREIDEFETRSQTDAHNARRVEGVFATDDAIWPLYFATVNRRVVNGLINWCEHVPGKSRYLFSIEADPAEPRSWTDGAVYALPRETFEPTPGSRELISLVPVRPRLRVAVTPADFPLRERTISFRRGESVRRVALRHARRLR